MSFACNKNSIQGSPNISLPSSPNFNRRGLNSSQLNTIELNAINPPNIGSNTKLNHNLTKFVWPKSRTLLSIISKMFYEHYITDYQRGILKELIMDHDPHLIKILNDYENTSNSYEMYQNIISLAKEKIAYNNNI